ncbi:Signal transduction histidine kinase [Lachnospiraceae bacterium YSD2013]|nr:Signal transduction histidine kinase [Lachnospiraceae bacterium YSD2013]
MRKYEAHRKSEDALRRSIDAIYREKDTDAAVERVLSITARFYSADRCYLYELYEDEECYKNTYEWCREGLKPIDKTMTYPQDIISTWLEEYGKEGEVWIASVEDEIRGGYVYDTLISQKVESIILSPIKNGKTIVGFLGLDNPKKSVDDRFLLRSVSVIIYSEIARRRQSRLQEREAEKQKRQLELDKSIIEVLANEYASAFYVDLDTDSLTPIRTDSAMEAHFGEFFKDKINYSPAYRIYVNTVVQEDDREDMFFAGSVTHLREALRETSLVIKRFRCLINGSEEIFEAKCVKVGNVNARPKIIVIGIANREIETREEQNRRIELIEANKRAEEASKAKSTFLFNMSHDIRTPMNAIIGYTDMAESNAGNPEKRDECLQKVKLASHQLLSLVNDVLDMARIENGKIAIEEMPNDIKVATGNCFQLSKQDGVAHGLNMTIEYRDIEHNMIFCDAARLNRIFTNIISNSVKYTKPGGNISFIVEELPGKRLGYARFKFTVTDTGIGMSEEFVKHIFESFSRERSTTASGVEGAGLGMAITKELVDMMGGTIDVKSELGTGTIVSIRIDFRIAENVSPDSADEEVDYDKGLEFKRVLLAEDNDMNREIAKHILESRGLIVEEANDGSVAVEMVLQKAPDYYDYVLMDVQMPYMDGYKATGAIRSFADSKYAKLPIIAMTANAFEEDRKKALMAGMDAHLAKPINVKDLFRTLQRFA